MAEEPFSGLNEQSIKNAQKIKSEVGEIKGSIDRLNRSLGEEKDLLDAIKSAFSGIASSADKVGRLQDSVKNSSKGVADALKQQKEQLNIIKNLNAQIDILYERAEESSGRTKSNLKSQAQNTAELRDRARQLADIFGEIVEDATKLNSSTMFFSKISDAIKDIPGLRQFSSPFELAAKASRQTVLDNAKNADISKTINTLTKEELEKGRGLTKEKIQQLGLTEAAKNQSGAAAASALRNFQATTKQSNVFMSGLSAGFKSVGEGVSNFFKGGGWIGALITGAVELFKFIKDAMFAADERVTNIARNLSISKENAAGVYGNLTNLKSVLDANIKNSKDLSEAFIQVSTATKFIGIATADQIDTQLQLTKELGLQVEEAQQLQGLFAANNIESSKGVDIVYDQVAAFANENKLLASGAKTLKEIQNTSKLILVNFRGNVGELTKTILEAQKLGLSLDQVNKVAGSLLNFEESISAELEAELLLGKDINLERARLFALNNDIAGVTKEIANQGITIESFSRMNRIQQEAIAKTLGMQAEELGKALYDAQVIEKLGGRDLEKKREKVRLQKEEALALNDQKAFAKAMSDEAMLAAIEKQMLTGKTLEDAEKSLSAQQKFNEALERAKELFSDLFTGEMLNTISDQIIALVKALESGRSGLSIFFGGTDTEFRQARRERELKEIANKEGITFEQAQQRENQRLEEKYNNPMYNPGLRFTGPKMAEGGIVTRPTVGLIGEAGQDEAVIPLNAFYAKIDQLIQTQQNTILAIKEGKDIYLDSNKLGTAQNIATTKT